MLCNSLHVSYFVVNQLHNLYIFVHTSLNYYLSIIFPVNMPVPGLYWADPASIRPVQARYWHITACLWGYLCNCWSKKCAATNADLRYFIIQSKISVNKCVNQPFWKSFYAFTVLLIAGHSGIWAGHKSFSNIYSEPHGMHCLF